MTKLPYTVKQQIFDANVKRQFAPLSEMIIAKYADRQIAISQAKHLKKDWGFAGTDRVVRYVVEEKNGKKSNQIFVAD